MSPVPQQSQFPGLQWHLLVTNRRDCYRPRVSQVIQQLLMLPAQLFPLRCRSRLLPFIVVVVALLWRCYSNRSSSCLSPGEMCKPQNVEVSLQPTCDQSVSYQQHQSMPLDACHSWASGKAHGVNSSQPLTWDIRTSLGMSDDHILQCLISSVLRWILHE